MKKLLIVVDYQNDFVDGALGFPGAEKLDDIIAGKIQDYRKNNQEVIFTLDTHRPDYLETEEGRKLPVPHCLEGTKGHELYGKVKDLVKPTDSVFIKDTFPSLDLGNYLRGKDYQEIEFQTGFQYLRVVECGYRESRLSECQNRHRCEGYPQPRCPLASSRLGSNERFIDGSKEL